MTISMTRRNFLNKLMGGLILFTGGCSKKWVWPIRGTDVGSVRLAFYTDVHARTEWQTPAAMAQAANAINGLKTDMVIVGGDLITDGFQSSAAEVEPRWEQVDPPAVNPDLRARHLTVEVDRRHRDLFLRLDVHGAPGPRLS